MTDSPTATDSATATATDSPTTAVEPRAPVTVIGLGPMGQALAGAFLAAGHRTTVWNRTSAKADALVERGAVRAGSPADAVADGGLVVVCVLDYDAALGVLADAGDALRGRTVLNLTAGSPDRARQAAEWAAERGFTYLDGAIMTPTQTIGTADAVFLHSGPETAYREHRATLDSLGGTGTFLGDDPGRAAAHEVALLDLWWTSVSGLVHSFALARSQGVAAGDLAPLARGIASLLGEVVDEFAEQADAGEYPGDDSNLVSAATALRHIIHASEEKGLDTGVLRAAVAVADRAIADGHGADSTLRMMETVSGRRQQRP